VSAPAPVHRWWAVPTVLDLDGTSTERFYRIVEEIPPRTRFTVNDLRERLDAADIPTAQRGALMRAATISGLIAAVTVSAWGVDYEVRAKSSHTASKQDTVRVFRRVDPNGDLDTDTEPEASAAVGAS
jgi:hypothetical protein